MSDVLEAGLPTKYFQRHVGNVQLLEDTHARFGRIIGPFPNACQDPNEKSRIASKVKMVASPHNIVLMGRSTGTAVSEFLHIVGENEARAGEGSNGTASDVITIHVIVIDEQMEDAGTKDISETYIREAKEVLKMPGIGTTRHILFVVTEERTDDKLEAIRNHLFECFQEQNIAISECIRQNMVIKDDTDQFITSVQMMLDDCAMSVLEDISKYVARFICVIGNKPSTSSLVSAVSADLTQMLSNRQYMLDLLQPNDDVTVDTQNVLTLTNAIADIITQTMSNDSCHRYSIQPYICDILVEKLRVKEKVSEALSEIRQIEQLALVSLNDKTGGENLSPETVSDIVDMITETINNVIVTMEKTMLSAGDIIAVMKRLQFQIQTCFTRSLTRKHLGYKETPVDKDFAADVLQLEGVFGIGHVFGNLEIHVTTGNDDILGEIASIAEQYQLAKTSYTVKQVKFKS